MKVNCSLGCEKLIVMKFVASSGTDDVEVLSASLSTLREWWERDANFLQDHHVCAADFSWIVRLDQDVTLFTAGGHYMRRVVDSIGGLDCVMEMMRNDFVPGECDPLGLQLYLDGLVASLIA